MKMNLINRESNPILKFKSSDFGDLSLWLKEKYILVTQYWHQFLLGTEIKGNPNNNTWRY